MRGFKKIQTANFNCVFGIEGNISMLENFKRIVYPAFKDTERKTTKNGVTSLFFKDIKIIDTLEIGYCLYGKIIKDTTLVAHTQLDPSDNLMDVDEKLRSAPYSEFILFLKNHKMLYVPSQPGSPTLYDFKRLTNNNISKIIRSNDFKEGDRRLTYDLDIFEIPEEAKLSKRLEEMESLEYLKFEIKPQNSRIFKNEDFENFKNLEEERKDTGSKTIEKKYTKSSNLERMKSIILGLRDMAKYSFKMKDKEGISQTIKNSTYRKNIEHRFSEELSNDKNVLEAVRICATDKRISELDAENTRVYNEIEEDLKKLIS